MAELSSAKSLSPHPRLIEQNRCRRKDRYEGVMACSGKGFPSARLHVSEPVHSCQRVFGTQAARYYTSTLNPHRDYLEVR